MATNKNKTTKLPTVASYQRMHEPKCNAICKLLRREINANLPKAKVKLYHGSPAWFIGENAVIGFSVMANNKVRLLFWNGRTLNEPMLKPVGKFKAAEFFFVTPTKLMANY